jgi:hypothetical protein
MKKLNFNKITPAELVVSSYPVASEKRKTAHGIVEGLTLPAFSQISTIPPIAIQKSDMSPDHWTKEIGTLRAVRPFVAQTSICEQVFTLTTHFFCKLHSFSFLLLLLLPKNIEI